MQETKAYLKNYRQSPRKVRLVADIVRGKPVEDAITILSFIPKRSALPLQKLLNSALANLPSDKQAQRGKNIVVKEVRVDAGPTLFRRRPRSRGMANPIRKRTSHISVTLAESGSKAKSNKLKAIS